MSADPLVSFPAYPTVTALVTPIGSFSTLHSADKCAVADSRRWRVQNRTRAARAGGRAFAPRRDHRAKRAARRPRSAGVCRQPRLRRGPIRPADFALLVEVRCGEPLMQVERVAGGGEDGAAVG